MTITITKNRPHFERELSLLRAVKPSDYDHMALFLGCCFARRENPQRQYTIRACLRNLYRMLDLNRHPLLHTTSRTSAPLGDPRGIPKISFSQSKFYLRLGDGEVTSVHSLTCEGSSVNIIIASTGARRIYFQVNIDISKMSDFVGSDLSLFDGLLGIFLNVKELEDTYTSDFDMNMFNDHPSLPTSSASTTPVDPTPDYTVVIKIPDEIDLLWNQDKFLASVEGPNQPEFPFRIDSQEEEEEGENQFVVKADIEREKNNKASREYRQRKKSKLAALQEEERELGAKNRQLRMQEAAMQDIVSRLKSKLVSVLANERPGLKRHQEDNSDFDNLAKKSRL